MGTTNKRLRIFAGPNGSGKSVFAEKNEGELYIHSQTVPVWFDRYILKKMHTGTSNNY